MKIHIGRLCIYALLSLLSLLAFTAAAYAQDKLVIQSSRPLTLQGTAGKTPKANAKPTHTKIAKPAAVYTYSVLYTFCPQANCADGTTPNAGLIQDTSGNLYGTVTAGGATGNGAVFKVSTAGQESVLYNFCSAANCTDGANPYAGLIQDSSGNLYSTTNSGGANCPSEGGCGTVFKVNTTDQETVLYSFCAVANCTDGYFPLAGLIQDSSGNFYGTTPAGGASDNGAVFKLSTTGQETVLYSFCSAASCTDGATPNAGLIQDAAGNLYGTTQDGGANGGGTVFKLNTTGKETVLYSFCSAANCTDGQGPAAGLIQDAAGNLYGTTLYGGANTAANFSYGGGTVFKVSTTGQETVLYSFCSVANCSDGFLPSSGLIQDTAGNLYGTTAAGGNSSSTCSFGSCGTVFELNASGQETLLYTFCTASNCTDGATPYAGLIQDSAGNLYGTTDEGGNGGNSACADYSGSGGCGTVFKLANGAKLTPGVTQTSTPNPSFVDQSVTFSAVVSGSGPTPTGTVTFEEGSTDLGTVTLANGKASLATTFTAAGGFSIVASYSGDQNYNPANSSALTQTVNQYKTTTALASNLNPSTFGQAVTFTATISSAGPTPTGTVTFNSGSATLGTATLSGGVAQLTTSTLAAGSSKITATYSGDAANAGSKSPILQQVVNQATSATTVVSSVNPSQAGQKVTFTATVTSPTTTPTGKVTFMDGTTALKTVTLANGKASYITSTLAAGSHNITAVYAGTANIIGSTSPVLVQVVN